MKVPNTQYARNKDVHIAFQVVGEAEIDVLLQSPLGFAIEDLWLEPSIKRSLEQIASYSRLILFDRRGTGDSDPVSTEDPPTMEQWVGDTTTVMDEVGSERASVIGVGTGANVGILLAATHPDRANNLILISAFARSQPDPPDYPWSAQTEDDSLADIWGQEAFRLNWSVPSRRDDEQLREWSNRAERRSMSPSSVRAHIAVTSAIDLRSALPTVRCPVLLIAYQAGGMADPAHSYYLRDHLDSARVFELSGPDFPVWSDERDRVLEEIQTFVTGERRPVSTDRVLATTLFTDIVGSTALAGEMGDKSWRELLDGHDRMAAEELARFRGNQIKGTGDGILATFDGPARAVKCAGALGASLRSLGIEIRAGLHTGEIEIRGNDISGISVHIAQRIEALAGPGETLVSQAVIDLVAGSGLEFDPRGEYELKGVRGRWQLYEAHV